MEPTSASAAAALFWLTEAFGRLARIVAAALDDGAEGSGESSGEAPPAAPAGRAAAGTQPPLCEEHGRASHADAASASGGDRDRECGYVFVE